MNRFLAPICVGLALPLAAAASPTFECEGGMPPTDAAPASMEATRFYQQIAQHLHVPSALGQTASVNRFCVARTAVFYAPTWLTAQHLTGSPSQSPGFAALAYIAGVAHLSSDRDLAAEARDLAGAHAAACALAGVGVQGDPLLLLRHELEILTGPRDNAADWRHAFDRGYGKCAAN